MFVPKIALIQPLFILAENSEKMGNAIIKFTHNYNKGARTSLISAKNDVDAISILNK